MFGMLDVAARADNQLARTFGRRALRVATQTAMVSFTFDDVPESALTGADILETHDARGTFYIAGGIAGQVVDGCRMISADGCAGLARRGHELGSHTFAHRQIRTYAARALAEDLERNARFLAESAGAGRNFAYPFNRASLRHMDQLRFRSARGGRPGINRGTVNALHLNAVEIDRSSREPELFEWVDRVAAEPGWLVFFTHDVADEPGPYGTTGTLFERLVAHTRRSGCDIVTVDDALDRLSATS